MGDFEGAKKRMHEDLPTSSAAQGPHRTGSPGLHIRPATRADLDQVIALDEEVTNIAKPDYWRSLLDRRPGPEQFFLVATEAGASAARILGFMLGEIRAWEFGSEPCGWVYTLSVREDARLHGIGQALFDAMSDEFRKAGVSKVRTMVGRDSRLHMLFFRALGMMAGPYIELEKEL